MKRNIIGLILSAIAFFSYNTVFAADALYRFMHNDHDALVLGEVTEVLENGVKINVVHQIISSQDLNESSPKKQISLKGAITVEGVDKYAFFRGENNAETSPQKGDYVLVSIIKKRNKYINEWGIYKVNSKDYRSLNVLYPKEASEGTKMDAIAIETFVNSNGTIHNFSFDGNAGKVYSNDTIIYENNAEDNENIESGDVVSLHANKNIFLYVLIGIIFIGVIIGAYVIRKRKRY